MRKKKYSDHQEKTLKFEAERQEFAKVLRSLELFVRTLKGQDNFLETECFLTCSWRFLRYNELEQLEFKLEQILGFTNL